MLESVSGEVEQAMASWAGPSDGPMTAVRLLLVSAPGTGTLPTAERVCSVLTERCRVFIDWRELIPEAVVTPSRTWKSFVITASLAVPVAMQKLPELVARVACASGASGELLAVSALPVSSTSQWALVQWVYMARHDYDGLDEEYDGWVILDSGSDGNDAAPYATLLDRLHPDDDPRFTDCCSSASCGGQSVLGL